MAQRAGAHAGLMKKLGVIQPAENRGNLNAFSWVEVPDPFWLPVVDLVGDAAARRIRRTA